MTCQYAMKADAAISPTSHVPPQWRWVAFVRMAKSGPAFACVTCPKLTQYPTAKKAEDGCRDALIKFGVSDVFVQIGESNRDTSKPKQIPAIENTRTSKHRT